MKSSTMPPCSGPGRGEVFDAARLVAAQDVAHARRFELEHAAGEALGEDLVAGGVIQRHIVESELDAAVLLDELDGVVDDGQGRQAEKIHLEQR
jgi:hypothetical protein